jgi:hypothetical protein
LLESGFDKVGYERNIKVSTVIENIFHQVLAQKYLFEKLPSDTILIFIIIMYHLEITLILMFHHRRPYNSSVVVTFPIRM